MSSSKESCSASRCIKDANSPVMSDNVYSIRQAQMTGWFGQLKRHDVISYHEPARHEKGPFPHLWILSSWHPTPAAPRTTSVPARQTSCQRALSQIETGTRPSPSSGCDASGRASGSNKRWLLKVVVLKPPSSKLLEPKVIDLSIMVSPLERSEIQPPSRCFA